MRPGHGVFKGIRFMGLSIQIDVHNTVMTDGQMGIFCLVGAAATFLEGYVPVALRHRIGRSNSKVMKATAYYITIAMLLLDPLYLSLLCDLFGGGDMNGISLLLPTLPARITFGLLLIINGFVFWKMVLPTYTHAFKE